MGLPKGRTNNKTGRPKGTPNKLTTELREQFTQLLENNLDKMQIDIDQLEPKDRVKVLLELSKFVIPVLRATEITTDLNDRFQPIVITGMVIN